MGYKVQIPKGESIIVPEAIQKEPLRDINGNVVGYDHINHVYYNDEIIPDEKVSPVIKELLEDNDENNVRAKRLRDRLVAVDENGERLDLKRRLGIPFEGYDDMDEDEIVAALHFLPGQTVQAVKDYEATKENRYKITSFNAGTRDNNFERVVGDPVKSSQRQDAEEKSATSELVTREVDVDAGTVVEGEGLQASDALTHEQAVQKKNQARGKDRTGTENRPRSRQRNNNQTSSSDGE